MTGPAVATTPIPGLLVLRLDVRRDERGWFEEAWQRERMTALGLPDFGPVQANVAWSRDGGTTRGMHAEPWDKLVTVVSGGLRLGAVALLGVGAPEGAALPVRGVVRRDRL